MARMDTHTHALNVRTTGHSEMIDITDRIENAVSASGVAEGVAIVYIPHTTAGVTVNENADPDVVRDMLEALASAVPWKQGFYRHGEGNSAAHVKSSIVGCTQTLLVSNGRLALGTWQAVFLCEFDGPRNRNVIVRVMG